MSAEESSSRKPSHWFFMQVGDCPETVKLIPLGDAAPSDDGRSYDLRLNVTLNVIAVPIEPAKFF